MRVEEQSTAKAETGRVCIVCGGSGPFPSTFGILRRCPDCGLVFAEPDLSEEAIARIYGTGYFRGGEYADYVGDKAVAQKSFRRKVAYMAAVAPHTRRVFEVGAAYGFFLQTAAERWQVAGIDIAREPAAYARNVLGLDVSHGDFLTAPIPTRHYDAFCMWDTIEHLARPDAFVERVAQLIAPNGYLFISTGDIASWLARRQGVSWRLIHPPTHLFYFSRTTLARLLERYGFQVRSIKAIGVHRSLRQTVYSLIVQRHGRWRSAYDWFAETRLSRMSYYLNVGDLMVVAAQACAHDGSQASGLPSLR